MNQPPRASGEYYRPPTHILLETLIQIERELLIRSVQQFNPAIISWEDVLNNPQVVLNYQEDRTERIEEPYDIYYDGKSNTNERPVYPVTIAELGSNGISFIRSGLPEEYMDYFYRRVHGEPGTLPVSVLDADAKVKYVEVIIHYPGKASERATILVSPDTPPQVAFMKDIAYVHNVSPIFVAGYDINESVIQKIEADDAFGQGAVVILGPESCEQIALGLVSTKQRSNGYATIRSDDPTS